MLNVNQLKAVNSTSSRILCLAGAGTGKTKTLVERINRLLNTVQTKSILCLTFTKVAGVEMKERLGNKSEGIFINTFHSFCCEIIRQRHDLFGVSENFSIIDQVDREDMIKNITKKLRLKIKKKDITEWFSTKSFNSKSAEEVINCYLFELKNNDSVDIELLIDNVISMLKENPDVLRQYHEQYKYVFVDEFQDTNDQQIEFLRLLNPANLFLVGDDYQAIYGFNGSKVEYILEIAKKPEYEVIRLENNYRSTKEIISGASNVISHNINKTEKRLVAHKSGNSIYYLPCKDFEEEINKIAAIIKNNHLADCCVIVRTNKLVAQTVDILKKNSISCETKINTILDDINVRKIITILEVISDPLNDSKMEQFLYQYEKEDMAEKIIVEAMDAEESYYETAMEYEDLKTIEFLEECEIEEIATLPISDCLCNLCNYGFIKEHLNISKILEFINFVSLWRNYIFKTDIKSDSIKSFLYWYKTRTNEEIALITNKPTSDTSNNVRVLTAHGSKGLEFDNVFVAGVTSTIFPNSRTDIEEERRLFYVAMTRAKSNLFLSYDSEHPSKFIKETKE